MAIKSGVPLTNKQKVLNFFKENSEEFYTDVEVGLVTKLGRKAVNSSRLELEANGVGFFIKTVPSGKGYNVTARKLNPKGVNINVDDRMEPIADEVLESIYSRSHSCRIRELVRALIKLNKTYWTIDQLAEELGAKKDSARPRLHSFMTTYRKEVGLHTLCKSKTEKSYLLTKPNPHAKVKKEKKAKANLENLTVQQRIHLVFSPINFDQ